MTALAQRLGVPHALLSKVPLLSGHALARPEVLFQEAFRIGKTDPESANLLLAAAILSRAQSTSEGRLAGSLSLLSRLVARANPYKTLGPEGAHLREEIMPSGWVEMTKSWKRLRYAWREGMSDLLDVGSEDTGIVQALNEITRLHPAEPEPVSVSIKEQFPKPRLAFAVSVLGIGLTLRFALREIRSNMKKRR